MTNWRHGRTPAIVSLVLAAAAMAGGAWLAALTGGFGATATACVAAAAAFAWAAHRTAVKPLTRNRAAWVVARTLVAVLLVWNTVSIVHYVVPDNGDTRSERMATWARNHGFSGVVDYLETRLYSTPPGKDPAKTLSLAPAVTPPTTTSTTTVRPPAGGSGAATTTSTLPAVPPPAPPAALTPLFSPALPGEGSWTPIARAGGEDAMWATSIRPLPSAGAVVASMVVLDQRHLRAGMFNGAEQPGGTWLRGNRVPVPLQAALVAAMNGGFRFEHFKGGYMTEGVMVKPMKQGDATLAVGRDGKLVLGEYGRDLTNDGTWSSLRQNLILIVDGGTSQVQKGLRQGVWWGADYGQEVYVPRSAVCELADGRLSYVLVGKVNAQQLADSLINLGCQKAIQLDINGTWPVFFTFGHQADGSLTPQFVDQRMGGNPRRYLTGSTKEFFAFFDTSLLPQSSVLDA